MNKLLIVGIIMVTVAFVILGSYMVDYRSTFRKVNPLYYPDKFDKELRLE